MTTLTPLKAPIALKTPSALQAERFFDPVVVEQRGVIVVGGPASLAVLLIGTQHRIWFSIKAHVRITGFTVSGGALYVQDGPVLSGWHLTEHRCFGAVNLVTEAFWPEKREDDEEDAEIEPPGDLYELSVGPKRLSSAALAAGEQPIFSAPMVRESQIGSASGRIFSLSAEGETVAVTDNLQVAGRFTHTKRPLRAELAMAELPQPSGNVLCYLYYVSDDGGIVALDGTTGLKPLTAQWPSSGTPVAEKVLPLRYREALLFGGGILGADFFAMTLDPAAPRRFTVPGPPDGWRSYEFSPADKLVLLSNGLVSRLISYDPAAKQRDRWRERRTARSKYSAFWRPTGADGESSSPKLIFEVDAVAAAERQNVEFSVLVSNTIDSTDLQYTSAYPPPAIELETGALAGTTTAFPSVGQLRCRPVIVQQTLYCIVRPAKTAPDASPDMLAAFAVAPLRTSVAAAADAALERLRNAAQPLRIKVDRIWTFTVPRRPKYGPVPAVNTALRMIVTPPGGARTERTMQTDGAGLVNFDTALAGAEVMVSPDMTDPGTQWVTTLDCTAARLEFGVVRTIQFTSHMYA
jgi:hypothetical protein